MTTCTLKRVFYEIFIITILNGIFLLLIFDIPFDFLLIETHCVYVITASPKMMPSEIPAEATVLLEHYHCALALQVPNYCGYCKLGRNR